MTNSLQQKMKDLLKLCRKRGHSTPEAEDLVHDVWVATETYSKEHEVRDRAAFMTTTLKNRSINAMRRAARFTTVSIRDSDQDPEDDTVLVDPGSGPEEVCSAEQRLEQYESLLIRQFGALTCDVFFYHRSGHTYQETAQEFGLTERAVEKHIAKAMFVLINHRAGERE
jgi:RNA polymerase sigma factor (sigma-70 family)